MSLTPPHWPLPAPMRRAFMLAQAASEVSEVPIGAVVTRGDEIVGEGNNRTRRDRDPTAHAEIVAIRAAAAALGNERLGDCALWVTLEPCAMCAGAIIHARLARLYYGATDAKGGAVTSGARLFASPGCLHRPDLYDGLGADRAAALLRQFFATRR